MIALSIFLMIVGFFSGLGTMVSFGDALVSFGEKRPKIIRSIYLTIFTIVLFFISFCVGLGQISSEGTEVGTISHFEYDGLIWKTYEGEMTLGVLQNGTGSTHSNQSKFCVLDPYINMKINSVLEKGTPIKMHYVEYFSIAPWRCRSSQVVMSIEPINK